MGLLTFGINVTLDGCCDHRVGVADEALHDYFTNLMDSAGAMLWGRATYELMESHWPAVARDENAPRALRDWAQKLDDKRKAVVSSTRHEFSWRNTVHLDHNDLRTAVVALKDATPAGVLVGSLSLAAALERWSLIDDYRFVVHPVVAGRGPTLLQGIELRRLQWVSTTTLPAGQVALHYRRSP